MINLLPRKEFTLTIKEQEYKGKFGTYSTKLFCDRRKIKLSEVSNIFKEGAELLEILDPVIDFIMCAIEYKCELNKVPMNLRRIDFYEAMDNGEFKDGELLEVLNHASDESKNAPRENQPAGMNSNDITIQPEESQTSSGT